MTKCIIRCRTPFLNNNWIMKNSIYLIFTILLISCASSKKLNKISIGMSKDQVIKILGKPVSIASPGENLEFLNYRFSETSDDAFYGITTPYYVLMEYGRVVQYGREGDFGVTKDPTVIIETRSDGDPAPSPNETIFETSMERMQKELKALKELYDEGILTKEEYEKKKQKILEKY